MDVAETGLQQHSQAGSRGCGALLLRLHVCVFGARSKLCKQVCVLAASGAHHHLLLSVRPTGHVTSCTGCSTLLI
jgi:hypothetical protein